MPKGGGRLVSREIRQFLSAIVSRHAAADEQRSIDMDAGAQVAGADLEAGKMAAVTREREAADTHAKAFSRGLQLAWDRKGRGGAELTLDDRKPDENAMADALIHFLVRFDLASSHSREVGDQHYAYVIAVDWDHIGELARANGQRLEDLFDSRNGAT